MFFVGLSTAAMQRNCATVVGGQVWTVEETAVGVRFGGGAADGAGWELVHDTAIRSAVPTILFDRPR